MENNNINSWGAIEEVFSKIDGAYAHNTLRAYRADMLEFHAYCQTVGGSALPTQPQVVADFVNKVLEYGIKSATIRRKISSISALHRLGGFNDCTKSPEVALAMRKMHRQLGRHSDQAHAVNLNHLEKFISATGLELRGLRDQALLLLGYDTLRRRAELVSLRIEDIEWRSDGSGSVLLRKSKTDPYGTGKYLHLSSRTCNALRRWIDAAQIDAGFILRAVHPGNIIGKDLGSGQIGRIYKRLARYAGLSEKIIVRISGHSLRVGAAQDMCQAGASLPQIMVKGGWSKPDTVVRYIERTTIASPQL